MSELPPKPMPGALYRNGFVKTRRLTLSFPRLIGRSRQTGLFIPDPVVSRWHCLVFANGWQWLVVDLGSRNGTYVNGQSIRRPQPARAGDIIQFGRRHAIELVGIDLLGRKVFNAGASR
jgi:pSer/pThr/pTyr-binding forkhead associated (FHA) protein